MLRISTVNQADYNNIALEVFGDGTSTVLVFDTGKTPFNINYQGKIPDSLFVPSFDATISATATLAVDGSGNVIATVTFNSPPPLVSNPDTDEIVGVNLMSIWNSL